jgi:hypothetical protein
MQICPRYKVLHAVLFHDGMIFSQSAIQGSRRDSDRLDHETEVLRRIGDSNQLMSYEDPLRTVSMSAGNDIVTVGTI